MAKGEKKPVEKKPTEKAPTEKCKTEKKILKDANQTTKRRRERQSIETYQIYIFKVLKQSIDFYVVIWCSAYENLFWI